MPLQENGLASLNTTSSKSAKEQININEAENGHIINWSNKNYQHKTFIAKNKAEVVEILEEVLGLN